MPALTLPSQSSSPPAKATSPIASWHHTLGLICIFLGSTAAGAYFQRHGKGQAQGSNTSHVPLYLCVIALDYSLFRYVKAGTISHGLSIRDLLGEPWNASRGMLRDLGMALGFWAVWKANRRAKAFQTPNLNRTRISRRAFRQVSASGEPLKIVFSPVRKMLVSPHFPRGWLTYPFKISAGK
jgi:hypothetical protein